jgi:predicted AlkP superfamily pyrophosphatase or phosphodiesterase
MLEAILSEATPMKTFPGQTRTRVWSLLLVLILASAACCAQALAPVREVPNPPNSAAQLSKPYVVLVSLDGFRYDYAERYGARHLLELAARGASAANGMFPVFPSLTFPNHYTIVTGLYPEHHGIVSNSFYDPARKEKYFYTDPKTNGDGSWYGGTPLWVLAEKQGMRSATFFWPGSEAEIQGKRPSYYMPYDHKFPDEKRVEQVLAWLRLPPDKRPHFITLYYSNVDDAGHVFGPDAPETGEAVRHVDDMIGELTDGIAALGLPVDLVVVSDHGMENEQGGWIALDQWADLTNFETSGTLVYAKSESDAERAYNSLLAVSDKFKVYRREKVPRDLHFDSNPREGDPVIVPTGPFALSAHARGNLTAPVRGVHGYDARTMPSMKAIFYAAGPDIRAGADVQPFEDIHLYPLIAEILGLKIGQVDGQLNALKVVLRKSNVR